MPLITRAGHKHECTLPWIGAMNPRTWFWGEDTVWQCRKCEKRWIIYLAINVDGDKFRKWVKEGPF